MTTPAATTVTAPVIRHGLPDDVALLKAMLAEVLAALHSSRHESVAVADTYGQQLLRRLYGRRSEPPRRPSVAAVPRPVARGSGGRHSTWPTVATATPARTKQAAARVMAGMVPCQPTRYAIAASTNCPRPNAPAVSCGQLRVVIGIEETSEQLDYVSGVLQAIR